MTPVSVLALGLLASPAAHAFCGTYVAPPGEHPTNHASTVILGRSGAYTTLTLVNDVQGEVSEFAMVVPVPEIVDDAHVVDGALVDRLLQFTMPRVVEYQCDEAFTHEHWPNATGCGFMLGCGSADSENTDYSDYGVEGGDLADLGVTVETAYAAGQYDVLVLSATGGDGLQTWLDLQGFTMPAGGEGILQEYVDQGSYFLAARVNMERTGGTSVLPPLQFSYSSSAISLPLKIGTASSDGEQEAVFVTLTSSQSGPLGIANYDETAIEDECMLPEAETEDYQAYYRSAIAEVQEPERPARWHTEYSWSQSLPVKCDPCTVDTPWQPGELSNFGVNESDGVHLTRLRMHYTPEQIDEDLVFYPTGRVGETEQIRYITYKRELEFLFPTCGSGFPENPGQCGGSEDPDVAPGGCTTPVPPFTWAIAGSLLLIGLRRREEVA